MIRETWFAMHEGPFMTAIDFFGVIEGYPAFAAYCQNCGDVFVEKLSK